MNKETVQYLFRLLKVAKQKNLDYARDSNDFYLWIMCHLGICVTIILTSKHKSFEVIKEVGLTEEIPFSVCINKTENNNGVYYFVQDNFHGIHSEVEKEDDTLEHFENLLTGKYWSTEQHFLYSYLDKFLEDCLLELL